MSQSNILWVVIELSADLFETLLLITLLSYLLGRRFKNNLIYIGTVLGLVAAIFAMNSLGFPDLATVGIYFVLSLVVATTLYRGTLLNSFLLLLVYNILWGGSEMGVLFLLSMIFGSPDNFALPTMQRLVGLISTKLVLFILVRLLIRFRQPKVRKLNWSYYLALLAFPVASVMTIISLNTIWIQQEVLPLPVLPIAAVSTIALLFANLMVFYLFDRLLTDADARTKLLLMERQIELEKKNLARAERQHTELRRLSHDLDKMVTPLAIYAQQGDLEKIQDSISNIRHQIDGNAIDIGSGNVFLDAILAEKITEALDREVTIRYQIDLAETDLPMHADEFCVLLGNALDNAIEGCERIPTRQDRVVHLMIRQDRGMLQMVLKNPLLAKPMMEENRILSSKSDKELHGLGIDSMNRIVKRNQGNLSIDTDENQFCLTIVLPLKIQLKT